MLDVLRKKLKDIKKRNTLELLLALEEAPEQCLSARVLGEVTELHAVTYPHLARLHREGLVISKWVSVEGKPDLSYALTDQGRDYIVLERGKNASGIPNKPLPPTIKPLVSRIAVWLD